MAAVSSTLRRRPGEPLPSRPHPEDLLTAEQRLHMPSVRGATAVSRVDMYTRECVGGRVCECSSDSLMHSTVLYLMYNNR